MVNNNMKEVYPIDTDNLDMINLQGGGEYNNNFPNNGNLMPNNGGQYGQGPQFNG